MTTFKIPPVTVYMLAAAIGLMIPPSLLSETKSEDAQALLQDVKKRDLERQTAAKQTEVNRLNEDLSKARKESDELKQSIDGMGVAILEATSHVDQLSAERTRLTQALEVTNLRIDAEKLKLHGLKMLSDAQSKALGTLTNRIDDTDLRATVGAAELKLMSDGPLLDGSDPVATESTSKLKSQITDLKKKRAKNERSTLEANTAAREAMLAASSKLQLADAAAGKARKRADELGLNDTANISSEKGAITGPKAIPIR